MQFAEPELHRSTSQEYHLIDVTRFEGEFISLKLRNVVGSGDFESVKAVLTRFLRPRDYLRQGIWYHGLNEVRETAWSHLFEGEVPEESSSNYA